MLGNLAEVRESWGKRPKVRERSGNLCSQRNLIVAAQQNNLPALVTKLFSDHHMTCLYFIRTAIHFSYVTFAENFD